jgi:hypothetical protein
MNIAMKISKNIANNSTTSKRSYTMIKKVSLQGCKGSLTYAN